MQLLFFYMQHLSFMCFLETAKLIDQGKKIKERLPSPYNSLLISVAAPSNARFLEDFYEFSASGDLCVS